MWSTRTQPWPRSLRTGFRPSSASRPGTRRTMWQHQRSLRVAVNSPRQAWPRRTRSASAYSNFARCDRETQALAAVASTLGAGRDERPVVDDIRSPVPVRYQNPRSHQLLVGEQQRGHDRRARDVVTATRRLVCPQLAPPHLADQNVRDLVLPRKRHSRTRRRSARRGPTCAPKTTPASGLPRANGAGRSYEGLRSPLALPPAVAGQRGITFDPASSSRG